MSPDLRPERRELVASLSVVALISNEKSTGLLLVKDRESGKWQPPAGGLGWLNEEGRMETFSEGLERELREETGITLDKQPELIGMINLQGKDKHRIGAIYKSSVGDTQLESYRPIDTEEIEEVRFFSQDELLSLLRGPGDINRPQFNRGLIIWWLRNEHRSSWDPYRGVEPADEGIRLDEKYLKKWELQQF